MTQAITGSNSTSFAGELATLLIQIESNQSESSRLTRDAARESYLDNAQKQVDALHVAADATRVGAVAAAVCTVASGGFSIAAASAQFDADVGKATNCNALQVASDELNAKLFDAAAKTSGAVATPLKSFVGDSTAEDFQAEAKRFETRGEQAKWQAGDASSSAEKADRLGDKVLDLLQGIQSDANNSTNAIIGRI